MVHYSCTRPGSPSPPRTSGRCLPALGRFYTHYLRAARISRRCPRGPSAPSLVTSSGSACGIMRRRASSAPPATRSWKIPAPRQQHQGLLVPYLTPRGKCFGIAVPPAYIWPAGCSVESRGCRCRSRTWTGDDTRHRGRPEAPELVRACHWRAQRTARRSMTSTPPSSSAPD